MKIILAVLFVLFLPIISFGQRNKKDDLKDSHEFFPSGYGFHRETDGSYHISPYLDDSINLCVHAGNRTVELMEKIDGSFVNCLALENNGGEYICDVGVSFEALVYKTSFGYCAVGVGFVKGINKVLLFAYPSRHPIRISMKDNIISIVWVDDYNTQLQHEPCIVTISFCWNDKDRQMRVNMPVFYDAMSYELLSIFEKFKCRPIIGRHFCFLRLKMISFK